MLVGQVQVIVIGKPAIEPEDGSLNLEFSQGPRTATNGYLHLGDALPRLWFGDRERYLVAPFKIGGAAPVGIGPDETIALHQIRAQQLERGIKGLESGLAHHEDLCT